MTGDEQARIGPQTSVPDPYFVRAGGGSRHVIFPGVEIQTIAGKSLMLSDVHLEPDSVVLEHSHPHEQMGILLEGRLEFTIGGVTRLLEPGDMWASPAGWSQPACGRWMGRRGRSIFFARSERIICELVGR